MWVSYFRCRSKEIPKSLAVKVGCNVLSRKFSVKSTQNVFNNCDVPNGRNFVFPGFGRREFVHRGVRISFSWGWCSFKVRPTYRSIDDTIIQPKFVRPTHRSIDDTLIQPKFVG